MIGLEIYSRLDPYIARVAHNPSYEQVYEGDYPELEETERIDTIYLCHIIEHLDECYVTCLPYDETLPSVAEVLTKSFRVLKHGGIIQITCTDFAKLCKIYKREGSLDYAIGGVDKIKDLIGQTVFDEGRLRRELTEIGFVNLNFHRVNPRYLDDDFIERFGEEAYQTRQLYEIYVEGVKL